MSKKATIIRKRELSETEISSIIHALICQKEGYEDGGNWDDSIQCRLFKMLLASTEVVVKYRDKEGTQTDREKWANENKLPEPPQVGEHVTISSGEHAGKTGVVICRPWTIAKGSYSQIAVQLDGLYNETVHLNYLSNLEDRK